MAGLAAEGSNYSNSGFDNDSLPVKSVASKGDDGGTAGAKTAAAIASFDKKPKLAKEQEQEVDDDDYSLDGDDMDEDDYSQDQDLSKKPSNQNKQTTTKQPDQQQKQEDSNIKALLLLDSKKKDMVAAEPEEKKNILVLNN